MRGSILHAEWHLKGTPNKWLDILALAKASLPAVNLVAQVKYYTARVSGRLDKGAPARQHAYLRALQTFPEIQIHFGTFLTNQKWAGLVPPPPLSKPVPVSLSVNPLPAVAYVWKTEEKGSDVNLGVHLVRDAFVGAFDEAAVLTNDTDLCEPMRIVKDEVGLPVTLLTPVSQPHASLVAVATSIRHVGPYVGPCQLPRPVVGKNGVQIHPPAGW
jgi:hypothetical protein